MWLQDGLFAAFLSAFLVFLIPQLQPNSTDLAMDVLIHISQQLSNSTTPAFVPTVATTTTSSFRVSPNAAVVNTLFFLSLALVLVDAFLAMLVKGWLQEFDRGWRKCTVAHLRAQERERRMQDLERWKLHELIALLPILIQGSLLLFCIGLIVLIFPLHLPSAILFSLFVSGLGFYGFTIYVSIVKKYAPFSSPAPRLLSRAVEILRTWYHLIARNVRRIVPAISFHNRPPLSPQEYRADTNASQETVQLLPLNNGVAEPPQPHNPDGIERSKVVPRSRFNIDTQAHIHVLERLVTATAEAVEHTPIFLELLDQPVKYPTIQPSSVEKWKELLHITLGSFGDQTTFSISAAWTLARTMMICHKHDTLDQQLCLALQDRLGSWKTDEIRPRLPLNLLFSSYLPFWLDYSCPYDMCRTIAFLEPSDAADAELLWMVNTFHRTMQKEDRFYYYLEFFGAVLTYVSSTEQSRRSHVPLTAAVIYAMHTITSAFYEGNGSIGSIDGLCILPGTVLTSESVPMTFCQVEGIDALDLWSEDCIQFVKDLLLQHWAAPWRQEFQLSLIAALYIDSTKQAHARSAFADLVKYTNTTGIHSKFSDAYDHGKLAVYWYMLVSHKTVDDDDYPLSSPYDVIGKTITEYSTLQLSGLHILEIAVNHVNKAAPSSFHWLEKSQSGLLIIPPYATCSTPLLGVDHWVLLHLDTLLSPQRYFLPEEVEELIWSDTPEKVHIAKARLALYDSFANAEPEGTKGPEPDPKLLTVFLWSLDYEVCVHAFRWCLHLVSISPPGTLEEADSTWVFIPETLVYTWIEQFIHVLSRHSSYDKGETWKFLAGYLVPKWTTLPSSWCHGFASAFLFSIVQLQDELELPAYQCLAEPIRFLPFDEQQALLSFLATMLELTKSSLTWATLTSFESWLSQLPEGLKKHDTHAQMDHILVARTQQLVEENLGYFVELPMAGS